MEIRDAIYGFISLNDEEKKIINSSLFQRLRKIRQLACEYLVYPCAVHTRFEHSLGVFHLASIMANKLLPLESDQERIVKLTALLHDAGHGPFSHVSEQILEIFSDTPGETEKIHEKITARLIETDKDIERIVGKDKVGQITGLLTGTKMDFSLMKQIVSGPIDADKQDYLLRDGYFCGVKYGVYDYLRLINTLDHYSEGRDKLIAINEDGLHALEQFILAKYYMTRQVYRHKVRLITDQMIVRGIELGITRDHNETLRKLYTFEDSDNYLDNYLKWWDDKIINHLVFETGNGFAHDIFTRLYERRLLKKVFSVKVKDCPEITGTRRTVLQGITKKENKAVRNKLEEAISHVLGTELETTILNSYMVKSVREMARDNDKEGEIAIIRADGGKSDFEKESTVFQSIDASLNEIWIDVYAVAEYADDRDKESKKKKWKEEILKILTQEA